LKDHSDIYIGGIWDIVTLMFTTFTNFYYQFRRNCAYDGLSKSFYQKKKLFKAFILFYFLFLFLFCFLEKSSFLNQV